MPLPRAVLEAEEKADKLHEELLKARNAPEGEEPPSDPPPSDPPADPPAPPAEPSDSKIPPASGQDEQLEHRYKVLQGKYNSEVPRLAAENKELKSKLQEFEVQLEALKNKPEPLVKPEEIEEYGEGLIDVARRIAREEVMKKDAEIEALKSRLESLSTTTAQKTEADFFKSLTDAVSDWEQINEDPAFLKWLGEIDDLTGETRQVLLSRAEASRDASRTARFFTRFKEASSSWAAKSTQALEQQVTPKTNKAAQTPPAKKIWSRGEVAEFFSRVRRGDVSEQDAIAIEADIHAAQIEGRIR